MSILPFMFVLVELLLFSTQISSKTNTVTQFLSLPDGRTLVTETFELGFFSPGGSTNRYVGIWFRNVPVKTVVWVANRDNPIRDESGILSISKEGNLILLSKNDTAQHWSTNVTTKTSTVIAQLLDTGNFVLQDEKGNIDGEAYLWQSFDYPTDTILPGMKLGWNLTSGLNKYLTAWKNWDDPSSGELTYGFITSNVLEMQMWNGSSMIYRSGPWNGIRYSGTPALKHVPLYSDHFTYNKDEYYFSYNPRNQSLISRTVINQTVYALQRFTWTEGNQTWEQYKNVPRHGCDSYNRCGSFGKCAVMDKMKAPTCECLSGFMPKSPQNLIGKDFSEGCVRSGSWRCREKNKDGFIKFQNLKLPDTKKSWIGRSITSEECKEKCWENCSCTAYANSDITGDDGNGSGCILWFGDLLDMRQLPDSGQDLYVRYTASQTANQDAKHGSRKMVVVVTTVSLIIAMLLVLTFFCWRRKTKSRGAARKINSKHYKSNTRIEEDVDLPTLDLFVLADATENFSESNKLGEGGFGPVYKGLMIDGQVIAVKRLSKKSGQGLQEFKNEVALIAKLQHRNLVRLLGCCIQGDEKILIYEYMPNKSLDCFVFDETKKMSLDWPMRFNIIGGIARGLLYLHQDSRLRIIHRDLKTSNILLDANFDPKISDFGLARTFLGDQVEANTIRVAGTYGYMPPEYAVRGHFSVKSDVFSYGVIVLEIVSGKKNREFSDAEHYHNLLGYAWRLWTEERALELLDEVLGERCTPSEVIRCIQVGLLCVQQRPEHRPDMSSVVLMLNGEKLLPKPKVPGFYIETDITPESDSLSANRNPCSANEISITELDAR